MTVKQIMRLRYETIEKKCHWRCETRYCLFPQHLWKYREDGFCIKQCFQFVDNWISADEAEIGVHNSRIQTLEDRIARYKEFKEKMKGEL